MPHPFERVTPDPEAHAMIAGLTKKFHSLYEDLMAACPSGPYREQAMRCLIEGGMWATKAITHEPK